MESYNHSREELIELIIKNLKNGNWIVAETYAKTLLDVYGFTAGDDPELSKALRAWWSEIEQERSKDYAAQVQEWINENPGKVTFH